MKSKRLISSGIILGILFVFLGASYMEEKTEYILETSFVLQGHRGLSNRYPENTMVSFQAAAESEKYRGIETDVQETKDGVLVLFHDDTLDKKTDAEGKISDYTFDQVRQMNLDVKHSKEYPDEKIPVLEDYLQICKESGKIPYIELKSLTEKGMAALVAMLDEEGWQDRCVITTFEKDLLELFRAHNSSYPVEYMVDKDEPYDIEEIVGYLEQYENMVFRPSAYVVTEEDVKVCREHGIDVECYGLKVGDKKQLKRLISMGVKGVTCNDCEGL